MKTALERLRELRATSIDESDLPQDCVMEIPVSAVAEVSVAGKMPLTDFAVARLIVPIFSEVIGEQVYFASDNAQIDEDEIGLYRGRVVYRASELRLILGCCADTIRNIHAVKKIMGGNVVGGE